MERRIELHNKLVAALGSRNVYFQPPPSVRMNYPAIRYSRSNIDNTYSNDEVYGQSFIYEVTVIDEDPDSVVVGAVSKIKGCSHTRSYTADGLNHDVFKIFY